MSRYKKLMCSPLTHDDCVQFFISIGSVFLPSFKYKDMEQTVIFFETVTVPKNFPSHGVHPTPFFDWNYLSLKYFVLEPSMFVWSKCNSQLLTYLQKYDDDVVQFLFGAVRSLLLLPQCFDRGNDTGIDELVYNKNLNFCLQESSKNGKGVPLCRSLDKEHSGPRMSTHFWV